MVALSLLACAGAGCSAPHLNMAREHFYEGRFCESADNLKATPPDDTSRVLFLMERGMMLQACGRYEESARDLVEAAGLAEQLDYISVTRSSSSLLSNDRVLAFRGMPYERTLAHSFAAKNYLAMELWDDAAVEARNAVRRLEALDGYPDDAYSHYMAGFCFEMSGDYDAASRQYRIADELLPDLVIDSAGRLTEAAGAPPPPPQAGSGAELVCFIAMGKSPDEGGFAGPADSHAEIHFGSRYAGRSYPLADTAALITQTARRLAAARLAKEAGRIAIKDTVANAIADENELVGELIRLVLFALEMPDTRRWETLPRWLEAARVPCPPDLKEFDVVFRNGTHGAAQRVRISRPLARRGKVFVSFCRDIQPVEEQ